MKTVSDVLEELDAAGLAAAYFRKHKEIKEKVNLANKNTTTLKLLNKSGTDKAVDTVYKFIRGPTINISADCGDTNAEITKKSVYKLIAALVEKTNLSESSVFLDGGCAYNVLASHVAQVVNCRVWGIEYVLSRIYLGLECFGKILEEQYASLVNTNIAYVPMNLYRCTHFGMSTHVYFFDEAFNEPLVEHCITVAANTPTVEYIISFKAAKTPRVEVYFQNAGFERIHKIEVSKTISGEKNTVYFYKRKFACNREKCTSDKLYNYASLDICWNGTLQEKRDLYTELTNQYYIDLPKNRSEVYKLTLD